MSPPSDERTDENLVAALNAGDNSAFDALYFRYRDWTVRLAHRFTGNADDALDVLQETFTYIFRKFPGFVLTARMTTFLYPVVKNLSIAVRQKRRRQVSNEAMRDAAGPSPGPADNCGDALAAALANLPEIHREALLMRYVDDMSLDEIAQALSVPQGTVKSRLHNAIATLRQDPKVREILRD